MGAVIFDMDGLMVDTERVFVKAWDYAGEKMGVGKAGYMNLKTLGMSVEMSKHIWAEEFGAAFDIGTLKKYTKEFLQRYYAQHNAPVKKGLHPLLVYLQQTRCKLAVASSSPRCKLAVASSSPRWEVERHLRGAGVEDYFSVVVCGDMVGRSKPDPEIYRTAAKLLGEHPEHCYALEDSKNGLLSAYRAGCKPIMVPDLWQPDEETLAIIYGKFQDLEEVQKYLIKTGI